MLFVTDTLPLPQPAIRRGLPGDPLRPQRQCCLRPRRPVLAGRADPQRRPIDGFGMVQVSNRSFTELPWGLGL